MRNKLGKRVLTMALAMALTFASCVTAFAQMGTDGDWYTEMTEWYYVSKGSENDAGQVTARAVIGESYYNDEQKAYLKTNYNSIIKEILGKDYFVSQSYIGTNSEWGAISKENLATMVTKRAELFVMNNDKNSVGWMETAEVTNSDLDYDGKFVVEDTEAVTNKLTSAGYTGYSMQFHTSGSGRLPGATKIYISDSRPEKAIMQEAGTTDGEGYLYYYDATADSFTLVDGAEYWSINDPYYHYSGNYFTSNDFKATKHGAYVFTTEKIADSAVKKVDVSLSTDTKFSTKDYVGKAMEVTTKNGGWYFPNVTTAVDFDPSFEVGKDLPAVSKKLSTVTLPATLKYVTLDFAFSGDLPGTANVTVNLASAGFTEGSTVYLYYYNPDKNIFELVCDAAYKNGSATFTMTHCSEYIVTSEKLPSALTATTPKTGDTTNAIPFVLALICGCAVVGFVVVRRRTVK